MEHEKDDGANKNQHRQGQFIADGQFSLEGETKEGGDVCIGSINIAGIDKVNGNGNYEFYWLQAKSIEDSLNLKDMQVGIRLWYRVDV